MRRLRHAFRDLRRMPGDFAGTRRQVAELQKELNTLNSDRADLKSEFWSQLGFYLHDFGREFSGASVQSQLYELARVQLEIKNLVTHTMTSLHSRLDTLENDKLFGLNEQVHEVTARLLERTALTDADSRDNWVAQPGRAISAGGAPAVRVLAEPGNQGVSQDFSALARTAGGHARCIPRHQGGKRRERGRPAIPDLSGPGRKQCSRAGARCRMRRVRPPVLSDGLPARACLRH